jgi:hypothetical protein
MSITASTLNLAFGATGAAETQRQMAYLQGQFQATRMSAVGFYQAAELLLASLTALEAKQVISATRVASMRSV